MIESISLRNFKIFKDEIKFELSNFNLLTGINGRGKSSFLQSLLILHQSLETQDKFDKILFNGSCVKLGAFSDVRNKRTSIEENIFYQIQTDNKKIEFEISEGDKDDMIGEINGANKSSEILFLKKIHYIAADRIGPQEYYLRRTLPEFINVGTRGEYTANVLLLKKGFIVNDNIAINEKIEEELSTSLSLELEIQIGEWLTKILDTETKVFIKNSENKHIISLTFEINKSKGLLPTNVGFGYTYILPIVVSGLIAQKDEILIIENPEAHLHPKAQHELTLFLTKVAKNGIQIFVETHSEHILNAARIATIKSGNILNKEEVSILYFQNNEEKPVVKIPLLENGAIEDWPDGFFDQTEKDFNKLFEF